MLILQLEDHAARVFDCQRLLQFEDALDLREKFAQYDVLECV
jgi:hypothetical protein